MLSLSRRPSWYRNVFANSHNRNPLAKVNTVFVNNVLYNGTAVDIDLAEIASGFSAVTPAFSVKASCGSVQLLNGHTAHFSPEAGFHGLASFDFTVTGSEKSTYTTTVAVAVQP